jgi:hypothetical protein
MVLKKKESLFGTSGGLVDVYAQGLLEVLPIHHKIIGQQQRQDPAIWLKSNILQFNDGETFQFKTLENPRWEWSVDLSDDQEHKDFETNLQNLNTNSSSANLNKKILSTFEEFRLNYEQHVKPKQKKVRISFGETKELFLLKFEDDLGQLDLKTVSKFALKDYRIEDYEMDSSKRGGGLGLYFTMKRSNVFIGTFIKDISTNIVVGFYKNRKTHGRYVFLEEK